MLSSKFEKIDEIVIIRDFGQVDVDTFISGEIKSDVVGFSFYEKGSAVIVSDSDRIVGDKSQMKWSLFFASEEIKYIHRELTKGVLLSQLTILFPIEFLKSKLSFESFSGSIIEKFLTPTDPYLDKKQEPITNELLSPVMKIIECKLIGDMRKLYLEAQCLELLSLLCFHRLDFQSNFNLDIHTIDKLHEARELLIKNFESPPSIDSLSKMVGLNTFALKNGFKKIFHLPIQTWINQYRMHYAREKIRSGNYSVTQVSEMLGYANANSFSYAFKSFYGYSPSQAK